MVRAILKTDCLLFKKTYRTRMCIECFDKKVKCEYCNSEFNKT